MQKNADDDKTTVYGPDKQPADLWPWPTLSPLSDHKDSPQPSQQPLPLGIQELISWPCQQLPAVSRQERALCPAARPNLDVAASEKLKDRERRLTAALFPRDRLPLAVKPISCSSDDMLCPVGTERGAHGILSYENPAVTLLKKRQYALQQSPDNRTDSAANSFLPSKQHKKRVRRHTICDSNPARRGLQATDSHTLLYSNGSDLNTVLCSAGSQEPSGTGSPGPNMDQLKAVETYFIGTVSMGGLIFKN